MAGKILTLLILLSVFVPEVSAGLAGNALEFDGDDDYVDCTTDPNLDITESITLASWVKGQFGSSSYHTIARKGAAYYLAVYERKPYARIQTGTGWKKIQGNTTLANDQWYHLIFMYTTSEGEKTTDLEDIDYLEEDSLSPLIPAGAGGQWDEHIREIGNVLYEPAEADPNRIYKAFYSGHQGSYVQDQVYVGYAYSADGQNWSKLGKVITRALEDPYVLKHDGVYYMFAEDKADTPFRNIRRHHSSDCNNWVDDGDVLDIQAGGNPPGWESQDVSSPTVWIEDGTWYMLYEGRGGGYQGKVGLATSSDGLAWVRDINNPVFDVGPAGSWDRDSVVPDDIRNVESRYYLVYHGHSPSGWQAGMAYTDDLYNWVKYDSNPVLNYSPIMFFYDQQYPAFVANQDNGIYLAYGYSSYPSPSLFLNGIEESYQLKDNFNHESIIVDAGALNIGRAPSGDPFSFQGTIDEVCLWNCAATACQIRMMRHGFLGGADPNVVAYWKCDEGSGQTVADCSINGIDGHLGSNPTGADISDPAWVVSGVDWENMLISDYDDSGDVDPCDLSKFCIDWLDEGNVSGDFNCDQIENFVDYSILADEW